MNKTSPYYEYPTAPRILRIAHGDSGDGDMMQRLRDGGMLFRPRASHNLPFEELHLAPSDIFDLVPPTIYGLLDDLIPGSNLAEQFVEELAEFERILKEPDRDMRYGIWVYYPARHHVVRFAPLFWHRLALLVRNSTLFQDPEMKMGWEEVRNLFEKSVVAVAGCSVGNNAAHALAGDMRAFHMKVADQKEYHIPNANRVRVSYEDFGRNKAQVTAEQLHAIDPFMKVSVYSEGVHPGNITDFVLGNESRDEPRSSVIVEEMDDPDMKILIREEARKHRIPVVMVTDLGSLVQLDIRRFDVRSDIPLAACGTSDEELYAARDQWRADLANREKFWEFAFTFIGHHYAKSSEFKGIIKKTCPILFGGLPQLGSTAMVAGGIASEAVARLLLCFPMPERMIIHKHTGETAVEGERL